jgi:hypothetical protein
MNLELLCDPAQIVEPFLVWSAKQSRNARGDGRSQRWHTVLTVAWVVNGFLSAQAAQELTSAEARGGPDVETARERVGRFGRWFRELEELAEKLPRPNHLNRRQRIAEVAAMVEAWRGTDRIDGLKKITRFVDALITEASAAVGDLSLAEQYECIQQGTLVPNAEWAAALRLATLLVIGQRIPLRGETFAQLTTGMWRTTSVQADPGRRRATPWEGAIRLEIPAALMKSGRDFNPSLLLPEHVGNEEYEKAVRRQLLQVWFCEGGARDYCRTTTNPKTGSVVMHDVPWLFPDFLPRAAAARTRAAPERQLTQSARKKPRTPRTPRGRWTRGRISSAFRSAVFRHADALCVDTAQLRALHGASTFHMLRRLFASFWAVRRLIYCCRMLDHADIVTTAMIYTAQDERTISLDVDADPEVGAERQKGQGSEMLAVLALLKSAQEDAASLREELVLQRRQHEELLRRITSTNAQAVA